MKRKSKLYIAIGCSIALVALIVAVLGIVRNTDTTDPTYPPLLDAADIYDQAVAEVNAQKSICATVSYIKETTIGAEVFRENSQQQLLYENTGAEEFRSYVTESLTAGTHTVEITELYDDGQCYFTVEGIPFRCQLTPEDYLARYTPITPINPEIYGSIDGIERNGEKVISFRHAAAPEDWAIPESCTLQYAEGTAYLSKEGQLKKSVYIISYTTGNAFVKYSVSVELQLDSTQTIPAPSDIQTYTPVEYIDGPRTLEIASGHLMDCGNIDAAYLEKIHCQLFGDLRTTEISMQTNHTNGWFAQVDTTVTVENTGKTGSISTKHQTEQFQNNTYSVHVDDVDSTENQEVSKNDMRSYCQDILVSTVVLPEYISNVSVTQTQTTLQLQFHTNDDFAQLLKSEALTYLYQNPAILQDKEYHAQTALCYLHIDKSTLLPVASGFQLTGNYTVDDLDYPLTYSADQNYQLYKTEH